MNEKGNVAGPRDPGLNVVVVEKVTTHSRVPGTVTLSHCTRCGKEGSPRYRSDLRTWSPKRVESRRWSRRRRPVRVSSRDQRSIGPGHKVPAGERRSQVFTGLTLRSIDVPDPGTPDLGVRIYDGFNPTDLAYRS